jgi:integrase
VPVPPKTAAGRRTILLPPPVSAALRHHRTRQKALRLAAGTTWEEHDLVFPNRMGRPMDELNRYKHHFRPSLKRAGLPAIRLHDLRHTAATWLIAQGKPITTVSGMLGHADVATTLRWYGHVLPSSQYELLTAWESLFAADS